MFEEDTVEISKPVRNLTTPREGNGKTTSVEFQLGK